MKSITAISIGRYVSAGKRADTQSMPGAMRGLFFGSATGMIIALIQVMDSLYGYYPQLSYFDSGILHNILFMTIIGAIIGSVVGRLQTAAKS